MTDIETVTTIAKEIRSVFRAEFGREGEERDLQRFLDDGLMSEYEDACTAEELEEAAALAIELYLQAPTPKKTMTKATMRALI